MTRLNDMIENHHNLDQLFSIFTHYGVNAQYVCMSVIKQFDQEKQEEKQEEQDKQEGSVNDPQDLIEDLKQFLARF